MNKTFTASKFHKLSQSSGCILLAVYELIIFEIELVRKHLSIVGAQNKITKNVINSDSDKQLAYLSSLQQLLMASDPV